MTNGPTACAARPKSMTFVKAEQSLLFIPTMLNSRRIEYLKRGRGWDRNRVRIKRVFSRKPAPRFHRDRPNRHYDRPIAARCRVHCTQRTVVVAIRTVVVEKTAYSIKTTGPKALFRPENNRRVDTSRSL